MYNITIFRDYIFKKPFFTTVFYFFVIFTFFMIPVSAELLEESYEGVNIYSDVNNSYDYSTRYEINTISESEGYTNYGISYSQNSRSYSCSSYLQEDDKPVEIEIDFNLNSGFKSVIAKSIRTVDPSFIEGTGFNLMDNGVNVGYGSFFMWADTDDKLLYLYELDYIDDLSGIKTLDIIYNDDTIFDFYGYYTIVISTGNRIRYYTCNGNGEGVYLRSMHKRKACNNQMDYHIQDMATTNTIENIVISENDIYYHYDIDSLLGYVEVDNIQSGYKIGLTNDLYNTSTEDDNEYYIYDTSYRSTDQQHNNNRKLGVKIDLYTDSTLNYPEHTFILDYGGIAQTDSGYYGDSGGLNFIRFNPDTFYSDNPHQYFDYYVHDTYSEYNFFVTSVILHPNYPQGIEDYQNNINNTMSGNHILLENEFTFVPNVYKLRLYATVNYPASVEDGILLAESNPISITAEYVPPSEPPEHPTDPPNATSINQTLNNSWSAGYYDMVLSTNEFFYLPLYNFVTWLTLPVTDLTNNMELYKDAMEDSFSSSTSEIASLASSINVIIGGIHPKVVNLMTYYLIWLILLVVLRKS